MSDLWTLAVLASGPTWQRADGVERTRIPASAYPVGAEARSCESACSCCRIYTVIEHVFTEGPVVGKTLAWSGEGVAPFAWFDAADYLANDTIMVTW